MERYPRDAANEGLLRRSLRLNMPDYRRQLKRKPGANPNALFYDLDAVTRDATLPNHQGHDGGRRRFHKQSKTRQNQRRDTC